MRQTIQLFLLVEAASFLVAGTIHSGLLVALDVHHPAAIAETTIGVVLLIGLGLSRVWPTQSRLFGLLAQAFAALGTLVGVYTIIAGFGPRTVPDVIYHLAILVVLGWGLVATARSGDVPALQR
jgi:hypothetical protein